MRRQAGLRKHLIDAAIGEAAAPMPRDRPGGAWRRLHLCVALVMCTEHAPSL
jgi:hypothetical protein